MIHAAHFRRPESTYTNKPKVTDKAQKIGEEITARSNDLIAPSRRYSSMALIAAIKTTIPAIILPIFFSMGN